MCTCARREYAENGKNSERSKKGSLLFNVDDGDDNDGNDGGIKEKKRKNSLWIDILLYV